VGIAHQNQDMLGIAHPTIKLNIFICYDNLKLALSNLITGHSNYKFKSLFSVKPNISK
jgi:hypothetical protein